MRTFPSQRVTVLIDTNNVAIVVRSAFFLAGNYRPLSDAMNGHEVARAVTRAHEILARDRLPRGADLADHHHRDRFKIEGSPTFVLNEGRQKLYGNVGYRVIEANIRELLRTPTAGEMSWC